jgi:3-oxoacyl-[acyl-carrier protein] reductase
MRLSISLVSRFLTFVSVFDSSQTRCCSVTGTDEDRVFFYGQNKIAQTEANRLYRMCMEARGRRRAAVETLGRLDIVVVNAGILLLGSVETVSLEDLDRMLNINIRGVFLAIQAAAPHLPEGGRVVTIGSNTAVRTGFAGSSVYAMTKAAVATMVKGIAIDLAPRRITVNNVQPGPTETDMAAAHIDRVKPLIPLRRVGQPSEIAALVAYLASEESGYMTGSSLTIDGGLVL